MELFDESDEEDLNLNTLKTNKSYAKHYDEFRKKEILSHLKNADDDDSSSSDSSTDEELVDPEFDKEFFKTLAYLKNKNPSKYEKIPTFFENLTPLEEKKKKSKKSKPFTVVDFQREQLLKNGGDVEEEKPAEVEEEDLTYIQEQKKLKEDLKSALKSSESDSEEEDEKGGLFKIREQSKEDQLKEEEDYLKWLADQKVDDVSEDVKELKPLKEYWHSEEISKADRFLRDYILNKKYVENQEIPTYDEIVNLSDDEKDVEQADEFEHHYNFRFEEPDNEFIKRYPRNLEDTVRISDESRKEKRKERKERKDKEKELKMKELQELNQIRKREIEEKLLLLKHASGNEDLPLQENDLDSEFDPDEHDRRMAKLFDNEYYGVDEGEQKPEFPEIEEEIAIENWDNFDKTKIEGWQEEDGGEGHCEDDEFNMDCDFDPQEAKKRKLQEELLTITKGRKRRRKLSRLAQLIKQEKPVYTPELNKTYEEYLEEYYKLDYEDVIGDQPCRFKYSECVPNDFGLTVEEILLASNKELNQWASLKKTMQNRPKNVEMNDVEKYNRKRNNFDLKKKIFPSIYEEKKEEETNVDEELKPSVEEVYQEVRNVKENKGEKKKKKVKKEKIENGGENEEVEEKVEEKTLKKKKEKKKGQKINEETDKKKEKSEKKKEKKIKNEKIVENQVKSEKFEGKKKKKEKMGKKEVKMENKEESLAKKEKEVKNNKENQKVEKDKKRKLEATPEHPKKKQELEENSNQKKNQENSGKKSRKNFKNKKKNFKKPEISDERFRAFGLNPKKVANKLKFGKSGNDGKFKKKNQWKVEK